MKIYELVWPDDRVAHIAEHAINPEEVEKVCFGRPFVQCAKSFGENPAYYVLGQTAAGRYLFCIVIQFPDGRGFPVTARLMKPKEKRRFNPTNGEDDENLTDSTHGFNRRTRTILGYS